MEDFRYAEFEMRQKHQKLMREAQHARVVREARAHRLALLRRDPCWQPRWRAVVDMVLGVFAARGSAVRPAAQDC